MIFMIFVLRDLNISFIFSVVIEVCSFFLKNCCLFFLHKYWSYRSPETKQKAKVKCLEISPKEMQKYSLWQFWLLC